MSVSPLTVEVSVAEALSSLLESGDDDVPEPAMLQHWAQAAYLEQSPAIVSVYITTSDEIQQLNRDYRNRDKATNVLSFPMQAPSDMPEDLSDQNGDGELPDLLGDLALCAEVISQESREQNKNAQSHWAHMIVHGMLHLQDYDHIQDDEADKMEALEIQILNKLGFKNPYLQEQ